MFFLDAFLDTAVNLIWRSSEEPKKETPLEICANDLAQEIFRALRHALNTHIKSKFGEIGNTVPFRDISSHTVTLYIAVRYAKSWDIHQRNFNSLKTQKLNADDEAYVNKTLKNIKKIYELAGTRRALVDELNQLNSSSYYLTSDQAEAIEKKEKEIAKNTKDYKDFCKKWKEKLKPRTLPSSSVRKAITAFMLEWSNLWVFAESSQRGPEFEGYVPHALVQSQLISGGEIKADFATKAVVPVEVVIEEKVNTNVTLLEIKIGDLIEKTDSVVHGYSLFSSADTPIQAETSRKDFINKAVKMALYKVSCDKAWEGLDLLMDVSLERPSPPS
jgi:hypothetical protein